MRLHVVLIPAVLAASATPAWAKKHCPNMTRSQAEFAARMSASSQVKTTTKGAFTVEPKEWKVRCTTKDPSKRVQSWTCRVTAGPCSGNVGVYYMSSCGLFTEEKAGCIAH